MLRGVRVGRDVADNALLNARGASCSDLLILKVVGVRLLVREVISRDELYVCCG